MGNGGYSYLFVEKVAYQAAIINQLEDDEFPVEGVEIHGQDKRTRLALISYLVKIGRVVFPECGAERLIGQLVGFGIEKHDDLADAFAILLIKVLEKEKHYNGLKKLDTNLAENRWKDMIKYDQKNATGKSAGCACRH